jgi:hypothetical protein
MKIHRLILICLFYVLSGCSSSNFTNYNQLGDLRILTVIADQPDVNPDSTVQFTPVLSDLNGGGRALNYSVQACLDPGVGIGNSPTCTDPDPTSIQSGTLAIPAGDSQTYTGPVTPFSLVMPSAEKVFSSRSSFEQYNGVSYLVFYTVSVPAGPSVKSFLRVTISNSTRLQKNQNPTLTSIDRDGIPVTGISSLPSSPVRFAATPLDTAVETYSSLKADGSLSIQKEEWMQTWFTSDGSFDFQRSLAKTDNYWTPPSSKPAGRGVVILVVTRDGRNGATFQKIEMN